MPKARILAALLAPVAAYGVTYQPPVSQSPTKVFEAPAHRWSPGNRGIEYQLPAGTAINASAAGTVVFAGPVAGNSYVTVQHADGLRTSYSYLSTIDVVVGQHIVAGARLGTGAARFQLGARRGQVYIDPQSLFAAERHRLVPLHSAPGHR